MLCCLYKALAYYSLLLLLKRGLVLRHWQKAVAMVDVMVDAGLT
jgi:hypothetical protein